MEEFHYILLACCFILSLALVWMIDRANDGYFHKKSKKKFVLFTLLGTVVFFVIGLFLFFIMTKVGILGIIVIIGLPGALISFLRKGKM